MFENLGHLPLFPRFTSLIKIGNRVSEVMRKSLDGSSFAVGLFSIEHSLKGTSTLY